MRIVKLLSHCARKATRLASKNAPTLLVTSGIVGMIGAIGLSARAGYISREKVAEVRKDVRYTSEDPRKEIVKSVVPLYLPVVIAAGGSIAAIVFGRKLDLKRQAALAAAYTTLSETMDIYQKKVIEHLEDGVEEHKKILGEIAEQDLVEKMPESYKDEHERGAQIVGKGDTLVYDRTTGRYFYSTVDIIREAESKITKMLLDGSVTVNDFYEMMGLPDYSYVGNAIGWDLDRCLPDIVFRSMLDEQNRPCLVLTYSTVVLHPEELKC